MADNIQIKDGNDILTTIATEDVGGREFQLIKVGFGVSGDYNNISNNTPLPVSYAGITSAVILNQQSFPSVLEVSGSVSTNGLTNSELRSSAIDVNVSNFPLVTSAYILNPSSGGISSDVNVLNFPTITSAYIVNQVSGGSGSSAVSVTNFPSIQEVSGTLSVNVLNQVESVSSVNVLNFPSLQGISGTISATLTNQNPIVSAVSITNFPTITSAYIVNQVSGSAGSSAVSITNFPAVQSVSGNLSATITNFPIPTSSVSEIGRAHV